MPRCASIKRDGGRCTTVVEPPLTHCYQHDPERAQERSRNAARAGKSAGGREIRDLKRRISEVVDAVLDGSQERGRAAVAIQGFNALRGALVLERKETEELEERIAELERAAEGNDRGGRRWGA